MPCTLLCLGNLCFAQGALMRGCGGFRKARMAFPSGGIGRSDGTRVIYLVTIYGKSSKKSLAPKPSKIHSGKLRTKSEILEALDDMPFDGDHLVVSANQFVAALQDSCKATLRRTSVRKAPSLAAAQIAELRKRLDPKSGS